MRDSKTIRILLVEDNPDDVEIVRWLLEKSRLALELHVVRDGQEALDFHDVILAAGAAGIQLLPQNILSDYGKQCKVVGDINAVPPLGIEGLKSTHKDKEFLPGKFGIGALAIGPLKIQIEAELFKQAVESKKGILDYKSAYEIAKAIA